MVVGSTGIPEVVSESARAHGRGVDVDRGVVDRVRESLLVLVFVHEQVEDDGDLVTVDAGSSGGMEDGDQGVGATLRRRAR